MFWNTWSSERKVSSVGFIITIVIFQFPGCCSCASCLFCNTEVQTFWDGSAFLGFFNISVSCKEFIVGLIASPSWIRVQNCKFNNEICALNKQTVGNMSSVAVVRWWCNCNLHNLCCKELTVYMIVCLGFSAELLVVGWHITVMMEVISKLFCANNHSLRQNEFF